jgi:hypothetical protein
MCKQENFATHIIEKSSWLYKAIYIIYPPVFYIRKWNRKRKLKKFYREITKHAALKMAEQIDKEIFEGLYKPIHITDDPGPVCQLRPGWQTWGMKYYCIPKDFYYQGKHIT